MAEKEKKKSIEELINDFDFSVLFREQEPTGLSSILPWVILVIQFIILIVLFFKKWTRKATLI